MYALNRATTLCELIFLGKVFIDQLKDKIKKFAVCVCIKVKLKRKNSRNRKITFQEMFVSFNQFMKTHERFLTSS